MNKTQAAKKIMQRLLLLVLLSPSAHAVGNLNSDLRGLVVGAGESYLQSEQKLNYAISDADRVAKAMRTAGRVPHGSIRQLSNPTVAEFDAAVKELKKTSVNKFMFYFSGHSTEEGLHLKDGSITKAKFQEMMGEIPAKIKIVVLDSCFSGALKAKGVKKSGAIEPVQYDVDEPTGSVTLTSSSGQELSYESENLKGSIFTYHLVSGLYGQADGNHDGVVTIDELYQYVYSQTKYQSMVSGGNVQHPEFHSKLTGQGALVVSYPARINGRLRLPPKFKGELTLASANGVTFFKFYKNKNENQAYGIPSGNYTITVADEEQLGTGKVELLADEEVQLKPADFIWTKKTEEKGQAKGETPEERSPTARRNEFLFGLEMGSHPGFGDKYLRGSMSEFFMLSPYAHGLGIDWRGSVNFGGQKNYFENGSLQEAGRRTIGFEGDFRGFESWNNDFLFGLRLGSFHPKLNKIAQKQLDFSRLYIGTRFYFKSTGIKLGINLGFEGLNDDGNELGKATVLNFNISY